MKIFGIENTGSFNILSLEPSTIVDISSSYDVTSSYALNGGGGGGVTDFLYPDWLPYLRHWIKPETLDFSTAVSYWYNGANRSNRYQAGSAPIITDYKGFIVPNYNGVAYHYTQDSGQFKVYFGSGSTGNYTYIALINATSGSIATSDHIENQYRDTANANHTVGTSFSSSGDSIVIKVSLRDASGNSVSAYLDYTSSLDNYKILVWTYDNSTGTLNLYNNGLFTSSINSSMNFETSITSVNSGRAGLGCFINTSNNPQAGFYFYGQIVERILYTDVKTNDQINKICKYLMNKYDDNTLWVNI